MPMVLTLQRLRDHNLPHWGAPVSAGHGLIQNPGLAPNLLFIPMRLVTLSSLDRDLEDSLLYGPVTIAQGGKRSLKQSKSKHMLQSTSSENLSVYQALQENSYTKFSRLINGPEGLMRACPCSRGWERTEDKTLLFWGNIK